MVGGVSAPGAALYSIGIPKDSVIQYEADLKAEPTSMVAGTLAAAAAFAVILDIVKVPVFRRLQIT